VVNARWRGDPPGAIDVLTGDASVFWVWLDGGRGRIAVYVDVETLLPEGYRL
jgi:hypothetical protein